MEVITLTKLTLAVDITLLEVMLDRSVSYLKTWVALKVANNVTDKMTSKLTNKVTNRVLLR